MSYMAEPQVPGDQRAQVRYRVSPLVPWDHGSRCATGRRATCPLGTRGAGELQGGARSLRDKGAQVSYRAEPGPLGIKGHR